ncbi:DNA-dependent RNA polymerase II, partial [Basidiobolus ranarum]
MDEEFFTEYGEEGEEEELEEITQEDCWAVITSFFEDKGLVRQQLDSFDEFIQNTIQEIVDESSNMVLQTTTQHSAHGGEVAKRFHIHFGQIYLSKPTMTESDGSTQSMYPQEARLRNLTYAAPLYVDMRKQVLIGDPNDPRNRDNTNFNDWHMVEDRTDRDSGNFTKVFIGKVPIMLRSTFCI